METTNNITNTIKKIASAIFSQFLILTLSIVTGFLLPKYLGTEFFGYWQIYVFYIGYLNLLGLGYNDGLSLIYAGKNWNELPFSKIRSSMKSIFVYIILLTMFFLLVVNLLLDNQLQFIWYFIVLNISLTIIQCIILSLFLATSRIDIYNIISILLKLFCTISYVSVIFLDIKSFEIIIIADFIARLIITIICIVCSLEIFIGPSESIKVGFKDLYTKSKVGIMITISAIIITAIPTVGKVIIQFRESASVYGIFSFAISLIGIISIFTKTTGMVIFPLLKRLNTKELPNFYNSFTFITNILVLFALICYVPVFYIITNYMSEYIEVLSYLHFVLASCIPMACVHLIITPYFKVFRLEKIFIGYNIMLLIPMYILILLAHIIFGTVLSVTIISLICMFIWKVFLEIKLLNKINTIKKQKDYVVEFFVIVMYPISIHVLGIFGVIVIFIPIMLFYMFYNKKHLTGLIKLIRKG